MRPHVQAHLETVLHHLYINPLEKCNLKCKICYTRKTSPILPSETILDFVRRYQETQAVQTITFCGGEVFALTSFPQLLNQLNEQGIFTQTITNGTLDQLDKLQFPHLNNLIVSLDGVEEYHDANRGVGNFQKSLSFMKKAHRLGFNLDVFSIVTHQNLEHIDEFEASLKKELGFLPEITFHPRKPPTYLNHHPISNVFGEVQGFDFLTKEEMIELMKTRTVFPPPRLGCYQIAVMSDGKVFGCCEGVTPIGRIEDQPAELIQKLRERVAIWETTDDDDHCLGCSQADFVCGIKEYLAIMREKERRAIKA
jgi:MoaA/NifB/PqqE/SkfB family radical SAM enzyme